MQTGRKAVVLLSGGLDSTTTLAIARAEGFEPYALTVRYGQRHAVEVVAARRVAQAYGVAEHKLIDVDLRLFGGSALTDEIEVPKDRPLAEMDAGIPITYVPARNTIFLSLALAWAEVLGAADIFLGVNVLDYSVSGDSLVWARTDRWARLLPIRDLHALPDEHVETIAVDPQTLAVEWRPVTGRYKHFVGHKRSFRIGLERGRTITVSGDHSLFTIDERLGTLRTVRGADIHVGMPIVVPFDLSDAAYAWSDELQVLDLRGIDERRQAPRRRTSVVVRDGFLTNRLGRTRISVDLPVTDDFLYIVGLWLAEGGKHTEAASSVLAFSIGGIPGAIETLEAFCAAFNIHLHRSRANSCDVAASSSALVEIFRHLGLTGTARRGDKCFPEFFWRLSQRQRRVMIAGFWDGDGSHVFNGEALLAQKSHMLIEDLYYCLLLDGIFPVVKAGQHGQKVLIMARTADLRQFGTLYPLRHPTKRASIQAAGDRIGKDKVTGLWKCSGIWSAVAAATTPAGTKTRVYNRGGKYDVSMRAQRDAFAPIPALENLVRSRLAFLRVTSIAEVRDEYMYDLSVDGAENFVADGILAHNSGYPDCRPEYIAAYERMANLATKAGVEGSQRLRIHTPLIEMTKAEIIRRGLALGVDYAITTSCYDPTPDGAACSRCDACQLRLKGFAEAGLPDPSPYRVTQPSRQG